MEITVFDLEGETVLYGEESVSGVVIHDDGDRLCVRFFGPELAGRVWVDTKDVRLSLQEKMDDFRPRKE